MTSSPFQAMVSLQMQLFLPTAAGFVLTRCGVITSAGSTTAILAQQYDGAAHFASCIIFLSTLLSIFTLPLLCLLL